MKSIISIFLIFCAFAVIGQSKPKGFVFASNSKAGNGIVLKWLYSDVYHPNGFDVYRSSGTDDWKKITTSPVLLNKNANDAKFDQETKQLYIATKDAPYQEFTESIAKAFVMMKAILNNDLATEIGIMYTDKSAVTGNKYKYKVTIANQAEAIAETEEITCGSFKDDFAPQEIILDRKKKNITFSWKPEVYNYYGVDIYRKEMEATDFEKITTIGPITIDIISQRKYKATDVFFTDTTINNEKGYIYKLKSINYLGQESKFSEDISAPIKDFTPPTTPFSFKVVPYSSQGIARLVWQAHEEEDLAGFEVYYSQNPDETFAKFTTELIGKDKRSFDVKNLEVGDYYFIIAAVDFSGNISPTGMMYGEMRDVVPPAAPSNLTCKAESGKISLKWDANKEGDLKGYYIQKSLSDSNNLDNSYVILNSDIITESQFEIELPKNVKNEFVYRVVALDTLFNMSKPSNNSLGQMPDVVPPKTPVLNGVSISEDSSALTVSWISNVDKDLAGYKLMRRNAKDTTYSQINISLIPKDLTTYKDRSVDYGSQYVYTLKATDNSGNDSDLSNEFSFTLKKKTSSASVIITNSKYSTRKKEISLEWKWEGEQELRGFVVYTMSDEGVMKPFSGLSEKSELKLKHELTSKKTFEIRAYTLEGVIISSKLISIQPDNN